MTTGISQIVFVVDGDVSMRESLESLRRCEGWQPETFGTTLEFLIRPRPVVPSCLVPDAALPDFNGLDLLKRIAFEGTAMPIMLIAGHGDVATSVQAMEAGAVELLDAIRAGLDPSRLARELEMRTLRNRYASLTGRERQVLALVVSGLLNTQVAGELGISEITVKAHRRRVMQKMQAKSFADLVKIATRLGPHRVLNSSSSADVAAQRNDLTLSCR